MGTWCQSPGLVRPLISVTLLATKVWNLFSSLLMYWRTMVLSVQNCEGSRSTSNSLRSSSSCLVARVAAHSSSLGIVRGFIGARRDLAISSTVLTRPSASTVFM